MCIGNFVLCIEKILQVFADARNTYIKQCNYCLLRILNHFAFMEHHARNQR